MIEWYEKFNSFHLWLCAQPANFDVNALPNQELNPAQQEERRQLSEIAYFDWRLVRSFGTLDANLPSFDDWRRTFPRRVFLARTGPPTVGLGSLDKLPLEILNCILSSLDISAIDQFKATNRRSLEVVDAHPQFRIINRQAYDTLLGLRAIKTKHMITVQTLFDKLCNSHCSECGDYGGYIYLVTFERVCCRCFTEKDQYLPLREIDAIKKFGLSLEILRTLPRFQGYPGHYGAGFRTEWFVREKEPYVLLIDRASAYEAGIVCHGSFKAMQEYVANADSKIWKSYEKEIEGREKKLAVERAVKKRENEARRKAEAKKRNAYKREIWTRREEREMRKGNGAAFIEGVEDPNEHTDNESLSTLFSEPDTDHASDNDTKGDSSNVRSDGEQRETEATSSEDSGDHEQFRYIAVVRVPWLNRKSGRDEWGFHCIGCEGLDKWLNHANRDFIMSTFREHLKECGPIRAGVHHINDCCEKGTCRKKETEYRTIYEGPFWRC